MVIARGNGQKTKPGHDCRPDLFDEMPLAAVRQLLDGQAIDNDQAEKCASRISENPRLLARPESSDWRLGVFFTVDCRVT